jgi:crossover junction endodeoxyribonuclease RuvC
MPGQGTRSMFTTGYGMGIWVGILATLEFPYTTVRPQVWKRALRLSKDKEASRLRAIQLFPGADLRRKKDHGRAEALLLAYYGCQQRGVLTVGR